MKIDQPLIEMMDEIKKYKATIVVDPSLAERRESYKNKYLEAGIARQDVASVTDFEIEKNGYKVGLRVYRSASAKPNSPALIYFHGGGFVLGDVEAYDNQSRALANACECVVIFVNYRLAPEHPFPAAADDGCDAYDWVLSNAEKIGVDRHKIIIGGDSAGSSISINAAQHAAHLDIQLPLALVLLYPALDWRPVFDAKIKQASIAQYANGYFLEVAALIWFAECYLPDPKMALEPRVSHVLSDELGLLPSTWIYAAEQDPLYTQGVGFYEMLKAADCDVHYKSFDSILHNFMGHAGISPASRKAFDEIAAQIKQIFANAD